MRVVLSADGTIEGRQALQWCLDHLGRDDEVIAVLGIDPVGRFALGVPPFNTLGDEREISRQVERDYGQPLADHAIQARTRVVMHNQGRAVADTASAEHADLIVVGKRSHGLVGDALHHEIAPYLVHRLPCAVVVVPTVTSHAAVAAS